MRVLFALTISTSGVDACIGIGSKSRAAWKDLYDLEAAKASISPGGLYYGQIKKSNEPLKVYVFLKDHTKRLWINFLDRWENHLKVCGVMRD